MAAGAASGVSTGSFALADGVVVDLDRQVAFVPGPGQGLEAIDLASGLPLWSADAAVKPLLQVGEVLIARADAREAGRLDLVSYDVRNGSPGSFRARVDLPEGVTARLRDTLTSSFRVRAALDGDRVVLAWSATKTSPADADQGYLPDPREGMAPALDASLVRKASAAAPRLEKGFAALDLASGRVRPMAKAVAIPGALDLLRDGQLKGVAGRQFTSADGRHVMASEHRAAADVWSAYRWTLYTRAGKRLGDLAHYSSSAPFLVAGTHLVFLAKPTLRAEGDRFVDTGLQLRAVDLASGVELWTKDVSGPDFDGPVPP